MYILFLLLSLKLFKDRVCANKWYLMYHSCNRWPANICWMSLKISFPSPSKSSEPKSCWMAQSFLHQCLCLHVTIYLKLPTLLLEMQELAHPSLFLETTWIHQVNWGFLTQPGKYLHLCLYCIMIHICLYAHLPKWGPKGQGLGLFSLVDPAPGWQTIIAAQLNIC